MNKIVKTFMVSIIALGFASATANAGTVKGVISAKAGGAPAAINITKDQAVCAKNPISDESLLVSGSGGLQNAVVEIVGAGSTEPIEVTMSQDGCRFAPHVITVTAESSVVVENKDGITHNFHTYGFDNDPVNFSQPGDMKTKKVEEGFEEVEVIKVQCDIHEWMAGWVVVTEGSAVAVTDANGAFTIDNVAPGNYKIKVWHEKLGESEGDIVVKDGDNAFSLAMGN